MRLLFKKPLPILINFKTLKFSTPSSFFNFRSFSSSLKSPGPAPMATAMPKPPPATTTTIDDGSGIASKCWIKYKKESTLSLYSPFVVALASGTLNLDTFRHYIAQDVYFLKAFAQAYELAEECADDDDAKVGISDLRKSVLEELKMHGSFAQEWGMEPKESSPNPATLKYTEFLLATASGKVEGVKAPGKLATPFEKTKVAAYTLGAMTPCMRLYSFLGKELNALLGNSDSTHPYQKWIDNYSSEIFQASALQTEDLLDKLSVSLTGEELDIIEKLYHQAMKLELEFFLAQPLVQPTVVPLSKEYKEAESHLVVFSDFDLTCSVVDSSAILAEIAIITAPKSDQNQEENQIARMSSADLKNTWAMLSKEYTEEYEQCVESILVSDKADSFDYERLHKALEQLSDFEKRANLRVIDSGVLKGLNLDDIKRAGERMILHDGCHNFFKCLRSDENLNADVHVLSYCWCADLIRSVFSAGGIDIQNIHANEFSYENSLSTGEIIKKVESPIDKVQAFSNILSGLENNNRRNLTVYIGDSVGDLLCLLKADVGIVLGSSSSLRRVGSHFGVSFVPLFPGLVEKQKECGVEGNSASSVWKGLSGKLYTVSSWAEINAFILGQ
ncbi:OLC1v1025867C1 [Oldenlandia corymbosa var. corymbosa]|uniref:OLC1v1025867C1 n=1 Tax=Oldenlandia corymbosa var. corymbosa TaxID=529605 RepID=A0AAV1C6E1_OLDCO|nr:OLC1v1025867C1 [Oldenlandia corymbosa var. corymbosa]